MSKSLLPAAIAALTVTHPGLSRASSQPSTRAGQQENARTPSVDASRERRPHVPTTAQEPNGPVTARDSGDATAPAAVSLSPGKTKIPQSSNEKQPTITRNTASREKASRAGSTNGNLHDRPRSPRPANGTVHPGHRDDKAANMPSRLSWAKVVRWMHITPSTTWYIGYEYHRQGDDTSNEFRITRGYVTLKFHPTAWFQPRVTMDTHQDSTGDWKVRLKYLHAKFVIPWQSRIITNPSMEVGLVHNPWFDYEEHIDRYRAEGPMFIERNGILNSADVGLTFGTLLGKKLDRSYRRKVSPKYPGEFGSIQLGIYNGAGYHAKEANTNKVFMSRESIRPLGSWFPNLQLTHFFVFGRSSTPREVCDDSGTCIPGQPRWMLNLFMVSMEHQYFTVTGQYAMGKGNQKGDKVNSTGSPLSFQGYSVFAEAKLPWIRSSIMGRIDWFDWTDDSKITRVLAGVAYHFFSHNFLLVSLDRASFSNSMDKPDWRIKATIQVHL